MKTIIKIQFLVAFASLFFASCKKDEAKLYYTDGTPPVLSAVAGADTVSFVNADKTVLTLNWTNPEYTFTTGINSLDVNYNIEIDTVGANFTSPNKKVIGISKDLSYSFIASDLNDIILNQMNLDTGMSHSLEIRVISSLTNNSAQLTSNSVQFITTPYVIPPKVAASPSGELYLVGSATDGGWSNPVPVPSQQFTKIDNLHFTITVPMKGAQEYLFLPVNGDWSHKYACKTEATQPLTGGDFGYDFSANFPGPTADGTYKIDVDFQKGKYTVTKQ